MMVDRGTSMPNAIAAVRRLQLWCALLLVVAALWTAREVVGFDYVAMDDDINVIFNPHLGPPGAESVRWMFTDVGYMRRYVPGGWLAFSGVYGFSGLSPAGYHGANLVVHAVNALLVYLLLLRLLDRYRGGTGARARTFAAMVTAGLWALHPFRAETVGWISGLLYGATGFWALLSALAYLQVSDTTGSRRSGWLAASVLAYAASIITYPMSVALPVAFVAIDFADGAGGREKPRAFAWLRLLGEKALFLLPGLAVVAVTLLGRYEVTSFWPKPPSWEEFTLGKRLAQAFALWAHYLWKTCWPMHLTPAPTWLFDVKPLAPVFVASAAAVAGISALLLARAWTWRGALAAWVAYLGLLGPLLGLTESPHFACDRYSYLAGLPLLAALACGMVSLPRPWRRAALVAAGICAVAGGALQREQLRIWRDSDALFARLIAESTDLDFKTDNFRKWALFHANRGNLARAADVVARARETVGAGAVEKMIRPALAPVENEAMTSRIGPIAAQFHLKLAMDFSRAGRRREAAEHFRSAWSYAPGAPVLAFNWAIFSALNGDPDFALRLYFGALRGPVEGVSDAAKIRLLTLMAEGWQSRSQPRRSVHAIDEALRVARRGPEAAPQERELLGLRARYAASP